MDRQLRSFERKVKQTAYTGNRDFDAETIDSIITYDRRMIQDLKSRGRIIRVARGLYVEVDRTLATLPAGAFDGMWDHINMNPPKDVELHA